MKRTKIIMMSFVCMLMLVCSSIAVNPAQSSHLNYIDTTLTSKLTDSTLIDTTKVISKELDGHSQKFAKLFPEVSNYVSRVSKRSCTEKNEIAKGICNIALDYDIDIHFILAQGTLETQLGTTGIGKSRKSIFGVYKTYSSYTACINDYARILTKSYLTRGRTEKDLMKKYVTTDGARYASNPIYEKELSNTYRKVRKEVNI